MTIWNGITEQGAVVPIQVDAQGRVVVSGGGGVPASVYGAAKAFGEVAANGTVIWAYNFTSSNSSTGIYQISFVVPMPSDQYIVLATGNHYQTTCISVGDKTTNGFKLTIKTTSNASINEVFGFSVFNAEPSEVTPLILPTSTVNEVKALRAELDKLKRDKTP